MQVLIIGIGLTMHDWTPRFLRALAADRECVILDSPGIGMSSIQPGSRPAAQDYFRFQASSVVGLVAALGLQQPDVLGWCERSSWGPPKPSLAYYGSQTTADEAPAQILVGARHVALLAESGLSWQQG